MVFNSISFILYFLPVFLTIYYITPAKMKNYILFAGSMVFYAYGEPWYILLLLASMALAYYSGRAVSQEKITSAGNKKRRYILAVALQIGLLLFFKCVPVFIRVSAAKSIGLPLGISFYTFQIISYLTDVYLGRIRGEQSFFDLAVYISMYPKISAGPIVSYGDIIGEIKERKVTIKNFDHGLKSFLYGLILKVLIADKLSLLWHEIQTAGFISISTPLAWIGAFTYSMQLYFDFYGYSMMAIGLGKMLGFTLPDNFDNPYMAKSVREFYRRWHITLGKWFTKYVYIPLGGSRRGIMITLRNLAVVWFLTSFWHGVGLNFLAWGMSLCFFIMLERILNNKRWLEKSFVFGHLYVLFVIPLTWVCFAITDVREMVTYFGRMFGFIGGMNIKPGDYLQALSNYWIYFITGIFFCTPYAKKIYDKMKSNVIGMFILAILFWVCMDGIKRAGNNPFLYLRF